MSDVQRNPIVTLRLERGDAIALELFPAHAPQSVRNFLELAASGFFNGLPFWRVQPGELIQSGSSNADGSGTAGYAIKGEFVENGCKNEIRFTRGTIGFSRITPDSASSAFFIVLKDMPQYDGKFAAFGRVIRGLETADRMSHAASVPLDKPLAFVHRASKPEHISAVEVETFGVHYPAPDKLEQPTQDQLRIALEKYLHDNHQAPG